MTRTKTAFLLLLLIWVYLFPYTEKLNNPNERTRVMQTRAMAEYGQLRVGSTTRDSNGRLKISDLYGNNFNRFFVNDVVVVCESEKEQHPDCPGAIYTAKAPGTSLLGVPWMALAYKLGLVAEGQAGERNATWILRVFGVMLPILLSLLLLMSVLKQADVSEDIRVAVLLATGLGTSVFPYALAFVGHALAGSALLTGVFLLKRATDSGTRTNLFALLGGLTASSAVLFEYHSVVAVACVGIWAITDKKLRPLIPAFALGALVAFSVHCAFHIPMFGSPFKTGHHFLSTAHNLAVQGHGFLGISGFHPKALVDFLFDPYMGFLPLMPWFIVCALVGIVQVIRKPSPNGYAGAHRCLAAVGIIYLLFVCTLEKWRAMNGWSIGPRFLTPTIIPVAVLAGIGWQNLLQWKPGLQGVITGLAIASILIMSAMTIAFSSPPNAFQNPFAEMALPLLTDGFAVHNLGSMLGMGGWSLIPLCLGLLTAIGLLLRAGTKKQWTASIVALVVASSWVLGLSCYKPTSADISVRTLNYVKQVSEGIRPE